ncbi:siderophore-interacting protein [Bifidobacterium sp.]|jgi:NADPH-dependent ferric siderophore reductase|uniref:siderophore-interacting protein n=1 Tax=Bifidobacterium sp. TaxID=41200 RepID=UPI0025BAD4BB|nr:siderophore-interacting protein [Bifidobacterium sp.]MCH4209700.1 siderophore-interacting protein [Bifidobacterium sp.]MCI1224530.1 siderophore-interacting protein [Bifidobacterium sp.]
MTKDTNAAERLNEPAFRPYLVHVSRVQRLSPHFMRITFAGDDLAGFGTDGYDQRIKLLLPLPDGTWPDPLLFERDSIRRGAWYEQWRVLPAGRQYTIRTYTIRKAHPERREVVVDFVIHEGAGPAGTFAARAKPGDEAGIVGPNARSADSAIGIDFHPGPATRLLLAADETAVPAVEAILESLQRDHWRGAADVVIEVPETADALDLPDIPGVHVDWLARGGETRGAASLERVRDIADHLGQASDGGVGNDGTMVDEDKANMLHERLTDGPADGGGSAENEILPKVDIDRELLWEVPESSGTTGFYAWVAGEAAGVRDIRRLLVREHHIDRRQVAFMGYWRQGRAEL